MRAAGQAYELFSGNPVLGERLPQARRWERTSVGAAFSSFLPGVGKEQWLHKVCKGFPVCL